MVLVGLFASAAGAEAPDLAVLKAYNRAASPWWDTVGAERAQQLLTEQLQAEQPHPVMAREALSEALADRQLWLTGELSPAGATKLGRQLQLRYLVAGTLVEFGTGGLRDNPRRGRKLFGLGGTKDFKVEFVLRLIDTTLGTTVWSNGRRTQAPVRDVIAAADVTTDEVESAMFQEALQPILVDLGAGLAEALANIPPPDTAGSEPADPEPVDPEPVDPEPDGPEPDGPEND